MYLNLSLSGGVVVYNIVGGEVGFEVFVRSDHVVSFESNSIGSVVYTEDLSIFT